MHEATLSCQNLWADSSTEGKEVLINNQYWDHIKDQLLHPPDLFPLEKFLNGLFSKHFV